MTVCWVGRLFITAGIPGYSCPLHIGLHFLYNLYKLAVPLVRHSWLCVLERSSGVRVKHHVCFLSDAWGTLDIKQKCARIYHYFETSDVDCSFLSFLFAFFFFFFGLNGYLPVVCRRLSLTLAYPIAPHVLNICNRDDVLVLIFLIISLNGSISLA